MDAVLDRDALERETPEQQTRSTHYEPPTLMALGSFLEHTRGGDFLDNEGTLRHKVV